LWFYHALDSGNNPAFWETPETKDSFG